MSIFADQGIVKDGLIPNRERFVNFYKNIWLTNLAKGIWSPNTQTYEAFFTITDPIIRKINETKSNINIKSSTTLAEIPFECRYHNGDFALFYVRMDLRHNFITLLITKEPYVRTTTIAEVWNRYHWVLDMENGWNNVKDVSGNITDNSFTRHGAPTTRKNALGVPILVFDGLDDYLRIGGVSALYNGTNNVTPVPFALIAGMEYDNTNTNTSMIYTQGNNNSPNNLLHMGFRSNTDLFMGYYSNDVDYDYTEADGETDIPDVIDGYYVFTSNGSRSVDNEGNGLNTKELWNTVSDTVLAENTGSVFNSTSTTGYLGRFGANASYYFKGAIYDVRMKKTQMTTGFWRLLRLNQTRHNEFWDFSKPFVGY